MDLFNLRAVIGLDTSEYERGIKNSSTLFSKTANGFKTTAKVIGTTVAAGIGAGAAAFGALAKASLDARGELEQNIGGAKKVFEDNAWDMEQIGKTAFSTMGLSASDFLGTANKMGAMFQGIGFNGKYAFETTNAAMQRAADVASIMGIDVSAAMEAVTGAAKGNFTMMDNLGVAINDAALAEYALSKGITKSTREMTTQEKVGLAMELFLEQTAYAAGNYARENETLAGSLTTAKAAFDNFLSGAGGVDELVDSFSNAGTVIVSNLIEILPRLTEGIGQIIANLSPMLPGLISSLLPAVVQGAVTLVEGLVAALPSLLGAISSVLPSLLMTIAGMLPTILQALYDGAAMIFASLASSLPELIPILLDTLFDLLLVRSEGNSKLLETGIAIIQGLITGIVNSFPVLAERVPEIIGTLSDSFQMGMDKLIEIGASILSWITGGIVGNTEQVEVVKTFFSGFMESISGAIQTGLAFISDAWNAVWPVLASLAESAFSALSTAWSTVGAPVFAVIKSIGEALLESWNTIWPSLQELASAAFGVISTAWTEIGQPVFDLIKSVVEDVIGFVGEFFVENFDTMSSTASDVLSTISETVSTVFSAIATFWTETLQPVLVAIGGFLSETLQPVWDEVFGGIKEIVNNTFDGIIKLWNDSLKPIFEGITNFLTGVFTGDWELAWTGIEEIVTGVWEGIKTTAETVWENIKTAIETPIESAKTIVSNAIDAIKGFFDFDFTWPDLKLPHFKFSGSWNPFDWPDQFPSIGVEWYNKAMNNPMLLRGATIFGMQDGRMLGGGDAGGEIVAGANTVVQMITDAVHSALSSGNLGGVVVNQNIYSEAKTAADLMQEARWEAERAVLTSV